MHNLLAMYQEKGRQGLRPRKRYKESAKSTDISRTPSSSRSIKPLISEGFSRIEHASRRPLFDGSIRLGIRSHKREIQSDRHSSSYYTSSFIIQGRRNLLPPVFQWKCQSGTDHDLHSIIHRRLWLTEGETNL